MRSLVRFVIAGAVLGVVFAQPDDVSASCCVGGPDDGAPCVIAGDCTLPGTCVTPTCGDNLPQCEEECDDGNLTARDGCSGLCLPDAFAVANPANPYDDRGQRHNAALDAVIQQKASFGTQPTRWLTKALAVGSDYLCTGTKLPKRETIKKVACRKATLGIGAAAVAMDVPTFPDLYAALAMSPATQMFIDDVVQVLDDSEGQVQVAIDAIKALEATVIATKSVNGEPLSRTAFEALLGSTAVARYSLAYWTAESAQPTSPWGSPPGQPDAPVANAKYDDDKAAKEDFKGAVTGGVVGGIFGGVAGAVTGVIGGAIGKSLEYVLDCFF